MSHPIYRVVSFERIGLYALRLQFDDGLIRAIDFEPILAGELFGPLRDPDAFGKVTLDKEVNTLVWANGADFDPATLHDWPEHEAEFITAAKLWREHHAMA
jgi:hypothetical protein